MSFEVSPEVVIGVVMAGLSLLFDYAPKIALWFDSLAESTKKLVVLGLASAVAAVVTIGQCYVGWFNTTLECSTWSIASLLYNIVIAVATMYGFHKSTKPGNSVRHRLGLPVA